MKPTLVLLNNNKGNKKGNPPRKPDKELTNQQHLDALKARLKFETSRK